MRLSFCYFPFLLCAETDESYVDDHVELALLKLAPRAATVKAVTREPGSQLPKLKVAALDAVTFNRLLGPLRDIMERRKYVDYSMDD